MLILVGGFNTAYAASIVVFGDSISAAYGIEVNKGWVAKFQQKLKQHKKTYQVINASVSGETTSGGLSRLHQVLSQYQPQILILELGGNDGLRGQPPKLMQQNLGNIYFAHSDMSGISNFEEAQYQGIKAAGHIMDKLGHKPG